jgi:hypothetical protein
MQTGRAQEVENKKLPPTLEPYWPFERESNLLSTNEIKIGKKLTVQINT